MRQSATESKRTVVTLDRVDVTIRGRRILRELSWQLDPGTHWGVIGANGSGKSTFLALLAGSLWPAPGAGARRYDFGNGPQRDAVAARRRITLVGHELQDIYTKRGWNFTAADVVLSGIHRTDIPRREPTRAHRLRARALLRELELDDLAARPFLELSRGEQRRVLIARGLAFAPRVLLLDEPAAGLDRHARAALDRLIERVGETTQIVAAGHSGEDLPSVVTHALELHAGEIRSQGPIERRPQARPPALRVAQPGAPRRGTHASTAALIEVTNASVWLGGRRVLDRIDWRLEPGEHWLVTGPNGAGKSTLLRLLNAQLRPARGGAVRWPGLGDPRSVWDLRRRVAWVSPELQAQYLYPSTVADCIGSGFAASIGRVRDLSPAERARVTELVHAFELEALRSRRLASLSYGQMHAALLARALAPRPRVLLADEPWEGLDRATAGLVRDRLADAQAGGAQIVCVSHLGAGGLDLDHELVLDGGRITRAAARARPRGDAGAARLGNSASAPSRESGSRRR